MSYSRDLIQNSEIAELSTGVILGIYSSSRHNLQYVLTLLYSTLSMGFISILCLLERCECTKFHDEYIYWKTYYLMVMKRNMNGL